MINNKNLIKKITLFLFIFFSFFYVNSIFALSGTITSSSYNVAVEESFVLTISAVSSEKIAALYIYRNFNRNSSQMIAQFVRGQSTGSITHSESTPGVYKYCGFVEKSYNNGVETSPNCIDVSVGIESKDNRKEDDKYFCVCDCERLPILVSLFTRKIGEEEWKKELKVKTGDKVEFLAVITKENESVYESGSFIILPEKNVSFINYSQIAGIKDLNNLEREEVNFSAEIISGEEKEFKVNVNLKTEEFESTSWVKFLREDLDSQEPIEYSESSSDNIDFCTCNCDMLPFSVSLFVRKELDSDNKEITEEEKKWLKELKVKTGDKVEFLAIIRNKTEEFIEKGNFIILPEKNVSFIDYSRVVGMKNLDSFKEEEANFSAEILPGKDENFEIKVIVRTDNFENTSWVNLIREDLIEENLNDAKEENDSSGSNILKKWWFWLLFIIIVSSFFSIFYYISKKDKEKEVI